jgi:hypothetical protein
MKKNIQRVTLLIILVLASAALSIVVPDNMNPDEIKDTPNNSIIELNNTQDDINRTTDRITNQSTERIGYENDSTTSSSTSFESPYTAVDGLNQSPFLNIKIPESRWFREVSRMENFNYRYKTSPDAGAGIEPAGVFVSDVNNDMRPDILAIGGESPVLYMNTRTGFNPRPMNVDFQPAYALFFDYNNNGWKDLLLLPHFRNSRDSPLFMQNNGGTFERKHIGLDVSLESPRAASAADYTGNGCLDIFIVQEGDWEKRRPVGFNNPEVSIQEDNGARNLLFAGDCENFNETTLDAGIKGESWSLSTSFVDLTNDGYPDIHVANDFNNDVLYLNNRDGTFDRRILPDFTNRNGMSSEVADVTGNGYLDIFVTNIRYSSIADVGRFGGRMQGNNLLVNKGNGNFVDRAAEYGIRDTGGWGWAAVFADFRNNGFLDLAHSVTAQSSPGYPSVWKGEGDEFVRLNPKKAGLQRSRGHGIASLDYNLDGSVDLVESEKGSTGTYKLYSNTEDSGNWTIIGVKHNRNHTSIGTRVVVEFNDRRHMKVKSSGSDYMSQSSSYLHFGLGNASEFDLKVERPSGTVHRYENMPANRRLEVQPGGNIVPTD